MSCNLFSIVALDMNLGLGYDNKILCHNPIDMFVFKTYSTYLKDCLVGRVTYNTLPQIVKQSRNLHVVSYQNVQNLTSINNYLVIGGNQIYKLYKDDIKVWLITIHKREHNNVDTYFDKDMYQEIINNSFLLEIYEDDDISINTYIKL